MENEENRGHNDKKAFEDQFSFGAISLFSLLHHTLRHLEHSSSTLALEEGKQRKDKEGKGSKGKQKIKQGRVRSSGYNEITCRYRVSCMISLLVLACMVHACVYLVLLLSLAWVFPGVTVVSALPFSDSHGVMWLFYLVELWIARWFWNWVRWS